MPPFLLKPPFSCLVQGWGRRRSPSDLLGLSILLTTCEKGSLRSGYLWVDELLFRDACEPSSSFPLSLIFGIPRPPPSCSFRGRQPPVDHHAASLPPESPVHFSTYFDISYRGSYQSTPKKAPPPAKVPAVELWQMIGA